MPKKQRELISAAEVAGLLRKDTRTVQRMAEHGQLPVAGKLPGRTGAYLFDAEDVAAHIAEKASA